jgi:hypothetical protein
MREQCLALNRPSLNLQVAIRMFTDGPTPYVLFMVLTYLDQELVWQRADRVGFV